MNASPYNMWEATCEDCETEMENCESSLTQSEDHMTKEKRLMRIETFICPNCGGQLTKRYIEDFQSND